MVYIYRKTIGGKPYYYLRVSKRVKGKLVVKDIAYLGSSIADVEKKLDSLSQYQKEIRKSYKSIKKVLQSNHYLEAIRTSKLKKDAYLDKKLLEQVEAIKLHYKKHFLKLDDTTIRETYKHFVIEFAFNTTSIEGNTITLKEANRLLQEDILPKNKTLREVYDLQNTEKSFFWLLDAEPPFNESLIVKVHDMLMENIDERKGYRSHDIGAFRSRFEVSPAKYVKTDVALLTKLLNRNKNKHPLSLATIFHHKMEKIHPFADGNGRTGRILMNYLLMQNGYPPLIVSKKRRSDYLNALSKADKADLQSVDANDYKKLANYLAEEMSTSYWNNFNV